MSSRKEEEKPRASWAIWLPTIVVTVGIAVWFFLFVTLDFGG